MRLFHELIFDRRIEGDVGTIGLSSTDDSVGPLLGQADDLRVFVIADQVEGTSPTLDVALIGSSADNPSVGGYALKSIVPGLAISPDTVNMFAASFTSSDATHPGPSDVSVFVWLSGTNVKARIRVWVTGRGAGQAR